MRPYLIDGILPVGSVNLIGGSSGAGKTRFIFDLINKWQDGLPVLGHASHPCPYAFVSLDRVRSSVEETLETMGLHTRITRLVCLEEVTKALTFGSVIKAVHDKYPDTKMLFIEGWLLLVPKGIDYRAVGLYMRDSSLIADANKITVLGVCHNAKARESNQIVKGREHISGSTSWSGFGETVITMDNDEATDVRSITVMPRNFPPEKFKMTMLDSGKIEVIPDTDGATKRGMDQMALELWVVEQVGKTLARWEIETAAAAMGISRATTGRRITDWLADGTLELVKYGTYLVKAPN